MEEKQKSFAVIKEIPGPNGIIETVIVDAHSEVLEFDSFDEADNIAKIMEVNSNHGYKYKVRTVGGS
jgi:hypothetical protein